MTRTMILAALVALFPAVSGAISLPWGGGDKPAAPLPPPPVVSEIVALTDPAARSVPGVIAARVEVALGFQTLGRLISRPVDLGDRVATGDLLAELNPDDLDSDVRAAEAAVESARTQLATAEATASRTRALAARSVASQAQLEQAERGLASARAAADQAQSQLIRARDAASFAVMRAPFDGVISATFQNPGAVVSAGEPVLQLSDENEREAVIDLPEAALAGLDDGSRFVVYSSGEQAPYEVGAVLRQIDPMADAATRTRRLHLRLDDPQAFRLGALIRARLASEGAEVLTVPQQAIAGNPEEPYLWIVTRNGDSATVLARPVTLGASIEGRVTVASGLSAGEEIVTRGVNSLTEGQPVGRSVKP